MVFSLPPPLFSPFISIGHRALCPPAAVPGHDVEFHWHRREQQRRLGLPVWRLRKGGRYRAFCMHRPCRPPSNHTCPSFTCVDVPPTAGPGLGSPRAARNRNDVQAQSPRRRHRAMGSRTNDSRLTRTIRHRTTHTASPPNRRPLYRAPKWGLALSPAHINLPAPSARPRFADAASKIGHAALILPGPLLSPSRTAS